MIDSYKILGKKITDWQPELQKSTAKEEKGTIVTEVGGQMNCAGRTEHTGKSRETISKTAGQ